MNHSRKLFPWFGALALALVVPCLARAEKLDLNRTEPVPANQPIPVMDFFRPELLRSPTVNLAGTHVAALVAGDEDHTSLMVYDLKTQKMEGRGARGDSDITFVQWLTDDLLVFMINYKKESNYVFCAGHPGSLSQAYPLLQNINGNLIVVPPGDRAHPLSRIGPHSDVTGQYGEVVTLDAKVNYGALMDLSGDGTLVSGKGIDDAAEGNVRHIVARHPVLETPQGWDTQYWADKDGKLAFAESSTGGVLTLHRLDGEKWVNCPEDPDQIEIIDSGDNPGEILVVGQRREGKPRALEILNAADGTSKGTLIEDPAYDFDGWVYRSPSTRAILGVIYDGAVPKVAWFDEGFRNLQNMFNKLDVFKGQTARIIGNSADGRGVLLLAYSDTHPATYYWADLKAKTFGPIKSSRPWIDPARMQPMGMIKYKTRDGHKLDAYVTMPAGATKQNPPPLVVLPPGSQWGRSRWGYDSEAQYFASRGYAVLQPNHRGSSGYRGMFPIEDEWDFKKMYQDVADATAAFVGTRLVDPNRVAIVGTNFGGFLALAAAAYEPSRYQCAVAVSPDAVDWGKYIKEDKYFEFSSPYYSRLVRKLGDPKLDPQKFDALSPLGHADQIRAAVLVCNGQYDPTFVTNETKELVSIVKRNRPTSDTIYFLNESGGVRHLANKVELYSRIDTFLSQNLGRSSAP
jgi:dipeptidyl aminopeptidase/acylaminoacyl peptidase